MYTGNYYSQDNEISIPKNYDGNVFTEKSERSEDMTIGIPKKISTETKISPQKENAFNSIIEENSDFEEKEKTAEEASISVPTGSLLKRFSLGKYVPQSIGKLFNLESFSLGTEEILIIAIAVFLLLSKSGDKECGIILLLLLLVN